jgi:hypothetical protein
MNETVETRIENGEKLSVWARLNVPSRPWSPAIAMRITSKVSGPRVAPMNKHSGQANRGFS